MTSPPDILACSYEDYRTHCPKGELILLGQAEGIDEVPFLDLQESPEYKLDESRIYAEEVDAVLRYVHQSFRDGAQTFLLVSEYGITLAPAFACVCRQMFYQDAVLAVATTVAQRPQCLPDLNVVASGDVLLGTGGALLSNVQEYIYTGIVVAPGGEVFYHENLS